MFDDYFFRFQNQILLPMKNLTFKKSIQYSRSISADNASNPTQQENSFQDNSEEAIQMRQFQSSIDNSDEVKQMMAYDNAVQYNENTQLKAEDAPKKKNNTGLPDKLKTGMENLSGMSLDDVKVHRNSDKPAQLQAHAYAQGTDIHLGPGQEKHLPHEAWHVVQQKQGRVKPTMQMRSKVNVNDDTGLEKEADVMGAKALQLTKNEPKTSPKKSSPISKNTAQLNEDEEEPNRERLKERRGAVNPEELLEFQKKEQIIEKMKVLEENTPMTHQDKLKHKGKNLLRASFDTLYESGKLGAAITTQGGSSLIPGLGISSFGGGAVDSGMKAGTTIFEASKAYHDAENGERTAAAFDSAGKNLAIDPDAPFPLQGLLNALKNLYKWRDLPENRFGDPSVIGEMDKLLEELADLGPFAEENYVELKKIRDDAQARFDRIAVKRATVKPEPGYDPEKTDWETAKGYLDKIPNSPHGNTHIIVAELKEELPKAFNPKARSKLVVLVLGRAIKKLDEIIGSQHAKRKLGSTKHDNAAKLKSLLTNIYISTLEQRQADPRLDEYAKKPEAILLDKVKGEVEKIIALLEAAKNATLDGTEEITEEDFLNTTITEDDFSNQISQ